MADPYASCTFGTEQYDRSSGVVGRLDTLCASFEVVHGEQRCIFRDGMSDAMARVICGAVCPMLRGASGVGCRRGSDYYVVLNRVLYRVAESGGAWRLVQQRTTRGGRQQPFSVVLKSIVFNIYIDASDVDIEFRNVAPTSVPVSTLPQYRRARTIVDQCYAHLMRGTPLPEDLERVTDPQYLCSLNYQMLWDVICSREFDKDPKIAAEQQAKLLGLVVQRDRKDLWPGSIHDFFKKAGYLNVFDEAVRHIVDQCRTRLSGLFAGWRAHLDARHAIVGVSKDVDRSSAVARQYLLEVNDNVQKDLAYHGEAVERAWF